MEAKDYTNIAGSPFQPYVKTQIEVRKALISNEVRTSSDLLWLTNRTSWIRISSGVNIDEKNTNFTEKGDALSKKYILQSGLTDHTGGSSTYKLREGLGPNGAYGLGGTEQFGLRPMPGLENLSIKTGGKLGTLREATLEFTCYNLEQLDLMNTLYMRLGFSILIEWGHIPFLDNKGILNPNPSPIGFYGVKTKEELMTKIQEKRVEHAGNYDAMWGTIKNFTYSFEGNGEFKCKVDLVGAGDILESLKINQSGNLKESVKAGNENYPVSSDANKSLLNEALYYYYDGKSTGNNPYILKGTLTHYFKKLGIDFNNFSSNKDLIKKGFHYSLLSKLNENNGGNKINIPDIPSPEFFFSKFKLDITLPSSDTEEKSNPETQVYITLGHLLLLTLATGGIYDKTESVDNPYIYIDINPETNRCYTFSGHCSLDPTVCLIGSENLPFAIDSSLFQNIYQGFPFYDISNPTYGGRFMWTLVNIDFIVKTLRKYSSSDPKGDINFVDFAQDILTSISKACGGFNEFRIVPDDDTRCIRIFDDRITPDYKHDTSKYLTIPVLGKDSLAYSFNYTSKISPQMATQIVIAAQAQDKGVQGNKDSLSFSHLNEGLINRLSPIRVDSVSDENPAESIDSTLAKYVELRNLLEDIYSGTSTVTLVDQETIDSRNEERGVTPNEDGSFTAPKDKIKDIIIGRLDFIRDSLINEAKDIPEEKNEIERFREAYNDVKADLEGRNEFEGYYFGEDTKTKTVKYRDNIIDVRLHRLLEDKYNDSGKWYEGDSAIEDVWTKLTVKQTKVDENWY